jgi:hypothetical protein
MRVDSRWCLGTGHVGPVTADNPRERKAHNRTALAKEFGGNYKKTSTKLMKFIRGSTAARTTPCLHIMPPLLGPDCY